MSYWNPSSDDEMSLDSPPTSPRRPPPSFNRGHVYNAGRSFSAEGASAEAAERAGRLPYESFGGTNDCGLRSMAGSQGLTPSELLLRAHGGNAEAARDQWRYHEQNQMSSMEFRALANASGRAVNAEYHLEHRRLPQRGQSATIVEGGHAYVVARSESGEHAAVVDYQRRSHGIARVNRVPDEQADRVSQRAFLQRNRGPSQER